MSVKALAQILIVLFLFLLLISQRVLCVFWMSPFSDMSFGNVSPSLCLSSHSFDSIFCRPDF